MVSRSTLTQHFEPAHVPRIVGIGASAGGLEALEQFLSQVVPGDGLAYIVVQHMDPTRKAILTELLQRCTTLAVREAEQNAKIEADTVYVIPPNRELTVDGGAIHLNALPQSRGQRMPIDALFCSLARDQGARASGVVLSGMGTDGTLGLGAIRAAGGLTLVQQPESAQFDSMPRSAIAAACVDVVGLPAGLPVAIVRTSAGLFPGREVASEPSGPEGAALSSILKLVADRCRHDLTLYKPSTLKRRIERRMAAHGLTTMDAYALLLLSNPQETELLFKELLIGVTAFFRDPDVWDELRESVIPALLERRGQQPGRLRAWVAGCSTGEEAYSLAMTFAEVAESRAEWAGADLQVFATDINPDAIALARRGVYPASATAEVSPSRLSRFFTPRGSGYLINASIRQTVLFAEHDVLRDPPFTRLDVLSCRNVLIYLGAALQQRLMPLFHYSLQPGGVLMLGGSETVGRAQGMFTPTRGKSRLYWRSENGIFAGALHFPTHRRRPVPIRNTPVSNAPKPSDPIVNLQSLADEALLHWASPPAVLVNEAGDIVYINGRTGRYLEPAAGKANWNVHAMARPGIRNGLAAALRNAFAQAQPVELFGLHTDEGLTDIVVDITVLRLREPKGLEDLALVVFRERAAVPMESRRGRRAKPGTAPPATVAAIEHYQAEIEALRHEMAASHEELQATNEELQSANEELQSANEELTTSKEEAQSMNEELQTINGELQSKLDDLALAQSDMQNLLNSTEIATLFLDSKLNVRRFTETICRVIHLREGDVGRPLSDLTTTLVYPQLDADARETLRTLIVSEKEISATEGRWFRVRIMPYRTQANAIQGVVITFVDISSAKELEARLRKA